MLNEIEVPDAALSMYEMNTSVADAALLDEKSCDVMVNVLVPVLTALYGWRV